MTNTSHRVILIAVGITAIAAIAIAVMPNTPAPEVSETEVAEVSVIDSVDMQISELIEKIQNGEGQPMMNIIALRDLANQYPERHKAQLWMGIFSAQIGQWDKAVARLQTARQADPSHEETIMRLSEALVQVNASQEAIDVLTEFVNEYPDGSEEAQERLNQYLSSKIEATTLDSNSLIVSQ